MDERVYPKVLVIAHNAFSNAQNNGKTLSAFFKGWPRECIAQIYLTQEEPDMTICDHFYRITDLETLKQLFNKTNIQEELNGNKEYTNNNLKKLFASIRKAYAKKIPFLDFIRNIIWSKVKPWRNKAVQEWIKEFNPDVIFFQTSNLYAIFDMVYEIKKSTKATLFLETTDDYVTKYFSLDPFYIFNTKRIIQRYQALVKESKKVFVIGEAMLEEYTERFAANCIIAMNSVEISNKVTPYEKKDNGSIIMTYAGNLGLNRWKVLAKVGKVIKQINKKTEIKTRLNIYSISEPNMTVRRKITIPNVCEYKGKLNDNELILARNQSDILLHVESFDKKNRQLTRLSISTKIPEYMLSQRSILAIGPKEVASIRYISDYRIGKVINTLDIDCLEKSIHELIVNKKEREVYIRNAIKIAKERHDFENNRNKVQNEILNYKN